MQENPMQTSDLIQELALSLRTAEARRAPMQPLRSRLPNDGGASAYAIQRRNVEHAIRAGRRVVGRKIGLTSPAVQRQFGVEQPDFGTLFSDMVFGDGESVPFARLIQPKVEAEVALVLGRDIPMLDATLVDVIGATEYVLPAIEIVDSRIAGWDIGFTDTVADNASSGAIVLGAVPTALAGLDLKLVEMNLLQGGQPVSSGNGAACLGHPLNAAVWLARKLAAMGEPLRAGDLVLTGALGPMVEAHRGDEFVAHVTGIGSVRTRFAAV